MRLNIAEKYIEYVTCHEDYFREFFHDYIIEENGPVDLRIECRVCDELELPEQEAVDCIKRSETKELIYSLDEEKSAAYVLDFEGGIISRTVFNRDYSSIQIDINSSYTDTKKSLEDRERIYASYAFANFFSYNRALILKAELVTFGGKCVALAGRSHKEERVVIKKEDGRLVACHTPWSKSMNMNEKKDIYSFVVLEDGFDEAVRNVSTIEAIYYLAKCAFKPHFETTVANKNMDEIKSIIKDYPIYKIVNSDMGKVMSLCEDFFRA